MGGLTRRIRSTVVLVALIALVLTVPASGATTWRTHASVSSRAGTEFVSEVTAGSTFRRADAVRLRFRSPDGTARSVDVWYYAECANGRQKQIDAKSPRRITTKAGGAWTNVTVFKAGTKPGSTDRLRDSVTRG